MTAINGTKENEIEDWAEGWEACLKRGFSCVLDNVVKNRLTASDSYVALDAGPDLYVDKIPCNIW